jgi:hypothetical protein
VAICLLGGFCWFRRRSGLKTKEIFSLGKPGAAQATLFHPSRSPTWKIHDPEGSQRANVVRSSSVARPSSSDDTSSNAHLEVVASPQAHAAQAAFHGGGSSVLPAEAYEMHSENLRELPTLTSGTMRRNELPVDNNGIRDHTSYEQQDRNIASPQMLPTSNGGSYAERQKPLPESK